MNIFLGYLFTFTYLFLVLLLTSFFQHKLKIKIDISRKIIHILVGLSWFIMAYFFKTSWHLIIPPLIFIIINFLSYKKNIISSMEKDSSKGTIYYAISFTILAFITVLKKDFLPYYGIGVLSMTIGDGLAPFGGKIYPKKIIHSNKTYTGSLIIILSTIGVILVFNSVYSLNISILKTLTLGLIGTILELVGQEYDNLTLPIGLSVITYLWR